MDYQDINAATIDRWVEEGWEWGKPISHETYVAATQGEWDVQLTPTKPVPKEWFGDLRGKRVLGLAAGGGQQMPIFAALGAECTVLDYSERQLDSERLVAEREAYNIRIVRADMTKPLPFADESFDLIFHPVSNCYVREVKPIWRECWRVLAPGGRLLAGTDHFVNYIVDADEREIVNSLPFDPVANEDQRRQLEEEDCGMQFSHTIEEQINGQLEAGFRMLALYEDTNGEGRLHQLGIPTFLAMLSVKEARTAPEDGELPEDHMYDTLEGEHIRLRKAREGDAPSMLRHVWSDEAVYRWMLFQPTLTVEDAEDRCRRSIAFQQDHFAWFIALKDTDEAIGYCGMKEPEPGHFEECGICLGTAFQGRGFGKEVVALLLNLAFLHLGAEDFRYSYFRENERSARLAAGFGFRYDHSYEITRPWDRTTFTSYSCLLTRDEYLARCVKPFESNNSPERG